MSDSKPTACFDATLLQPQGFGGDAPWAFVVLPKEVSNMLSRRGRTTVAVIVNGRPFQAMLEPDGQLSHWLRIPGALMEAADLKFGSSARFEISALQSEPEPELPLDLQSALSSSPEAQQVWRDTSTIARIDWIHWICSAKQAKTRAKRIRDACEMLAAGKRRVCCFDPSGFYSKALSAPKAID